MSVLKWCWWWCFGFSQLLAVLCDGAIQYSNFQTCSSQQQQAVLAGVPHCSPRETIIDLRQFVSNMSDVLQVIPDVVSVRRCEGMCNRISHRCIPTRVTYKRVPSLLVVARFPHGIHPTKCGHMEVEEHEACECGCPIQEADCLRQNKYFESGSCRCMCHNQEERRSCVEANMFWDESQCRCRCPLSRYVVCSTGYVFDLDRTCTCVPMGMRASLGLICALSLLSVGLFITVLGAYAMYRKRLGIFRPSAQARLQQESLRFTKEEIQKLDLN